MALGRGLDALLGDTTLQAQTGGSVNLPIAQVEPGLNQPRKHFDEEALAAIPYFGKKSSEKYGRFILEIVHKYCKEKDLL